MVLCDGNSRPLLYTAYDSFFLYLTVQNSSVIKKDGMNVPHSSHYPKHVQASNDHLWFWGREYSR